MRPLTYNWRADGTDHVLEVVHAEGTNGRPFSFGDTGQSRLTEVQSFFIATVPVTQALWIHVVGPDSNPSLHRASQLPVEDVSWDEITRTGGFLDQLNDSPVRAAMAAQSLGRSVAFRLPSETEWEYAARGGPQWRDGFRFSGSNDVDAVAWYDRRHGDHTQPVAQKAPNQLGIYDMSGNVWEWCEDVFTPDIARIPADGSAFGGPGADRVLRGGCFHNWAIHCTVSKRYEIARDYRDGCIGLRLVLSFDSASGGNGA